MLEEGYVKIYRSLLKWEWYDDINTFRVFLHLLLTVNYYDEQWHGVTVKRGSRISSYGKLAKETGLSIQNVRTSIKRLISTGEVTHRATPKYGLFTVVNFDKYQTLTHNLTVSQHTANTQLTHSQQQSKKANKARKQESNNKNKIEFAEFVTMTQEEYDKLVDRIGERGTKRCIEILDNYKGSVGKKYASDYRAILNWVIARYEEEPKPEPEPVEYIPPNPEDDIPFRKSLPKGATLSEWLPPTTEAG